MKRTSLLLLIPVVVLLMACADAGPYARFDGTSLAKMSVERPSFDASGLRVPVAVECSIPTIVRWCPVDKPQCRPEPDAKTYRSAECPQELVSGEFLVRAPWGKEYRSAVALTDEPPVAHSSAEKQGTAAGSAHAPQKNPVPLKGVFAVKIDWSATGMTPGEPPDAAKLGRGWSVRSADGRLEAPLTLSGQEVQALSAMISQNTRSDVDNVVGRPGEYAELSVTLSSASFASGTNRIMVSVTNRGPDPAYKVAVHLRSSSMVIHGIYLEVGHLNPGETAEKVKRLAAINATDELDPMVSVEVTAWNTPPVKTSNRFHLAVSTVPRATPIQLSCLPVEKDAAPGQQVRIRCRSTNPNDKAIQSMSLQVAVGTANAAPADGPTQIAPHASVMFDLAPTLPACAKAGSALPIIITINASDSAPVQQQIVQQISAVGVCPQGMLTRATYLATRKGMRAMLSSGALSKVDFDDRDAELVSCLQ